jgi:hypothetical protein
VSVTNGREKKLVPLAKTQRRREQRKTGRGKAGRRPVISWCLGERKGIRFFCRVGRDVTVIMLWFLSHRNILRGEPLITTPYLAWSVRSLKRDLPQR